MVTWIPSWRQRRTLQSSATLSRLTENWSPWVGCAVFAPSYRQDLTRLYDRRIKFRCQLLHRDGLCASFRLDHPKQVSKGISITRQSKILTYWLPRLNAGTGSRSQMSSIITSIFAIMTLFLLQYFHYLPKVRYQSTCPSVGRA